MQETSSTSAALSTQSCGFFDVLWAVAIFSIVLVTGLHNLGAVEFLRHTEADRALLGLSIFETGDLVVPRLLEDTYLTKPPLFYWLVALSYYSTGTVADWSARLVSLLSLSILTSSLFLTIRFAGWGRREAFVTAMITATLISVAVGGVVAEIDLTFTLFCALATLFGFFLTRNPNSLVIAIWTGVMLAAALLTKGPLVLILYGGGLLFYLPLIIMRRLKQKNSFSLIRNHFRAHGLALFIALLLFSIWLLPLIIRIGPEDLTEIFNTELISRFTSDSKAGIRGRGAFFYGQSLFLGTFPWSGIVAGMLIFLIIKAPRTLKQILLPATDIEKFAWFSCVPYLLFLSLASGKSPRYALPIYPFVAIIIAAVVIRGSHALHDVSKAIPDLKQVSLRKLVLSFILLLLVIRGSYSFVYGPLRNRALSIKPVVTQFNEALPTEEPIYVAELFQRWLLFYLRTLGHRPLRITPTLVKSFEQKKDEKIFVVLDGIHESFRLQDFTAAQIPYEEIKRVKTVKGPFVLIRMLARDIKIFHPERIFPTVPSWERGLTQQPAAFLPDPTLEPVPGTVSEN